MRAAFCVVTSLVAACAAPPPDCAALTEQYAAAFEAAQACDPSAVNACLERRPVVMRIEGGGTVQSGIAPYCQRPVNAGKTAPVDQLLNEYYEAECELLVPPGCVVMAGSTTAATCVPDALGAGKCGYAQ